MLVLENKIIRRRGIIILLILALNITGLFLCQNVVYADSKVLSEELYYHLDMGVQIAYNPGCDWGRDHIYGSTAPLSLNTTIGFNSDVEVFDTYPLNSLKGSSFDFNGETSSHNIPNSLGDASWAYNEFYSNYVSTSITEGNCSSSGRNVSFNYTASLNTAMGLEVVEYGKYGNDQEIYRLFGGKSALEADQPEIAEAIDLALKAGREGTAGTNKLYLIFCPNVIVYKKYVTVGELEAKLTLPSTAKQGESYTASDASIIDRNLTVDNAVLEKHYGDGNWETVAVWNGPGSQGRNTGGSATESSDEVGTVTYRLTVNTTTDQTDTDIKTIRITDGREIDGQAILELPAFTYEGHPALAEDVSEFTVDGVHYSARRAYEEDVAENRFLPLPKSSGTANRESLTTANVVFPSRGNYQVKLEVDTISGDMLTDIKPITVRKTPYIIDNLGGFQKQNRKQMLSISVATYPGKPITDYYVKLKDLKTGSEITLNKSQPMQNNATIKTRAITSSGDAYWTNFELQFLTKTPAYDPGDPDKTQEFRYTIYMKDSKGDTDTVQKDFTVRPDLPPNAKIIIQDSFIRNKGTNIAEIMAEDGSTTDGDQLSRIWSAGGVNLTGMPGYKDLSFGSRQKVQYNKVGVGKDTINLTVKDIWTEPSLEEYITAADYLSASTTAATDVINIAPAVRLEPLETETADVVIVTQKASESAIKTELNSMKAALIEAGIDANIQVIPTAKPNNDGYKIIGGTTWKTAINDQNQRQAGLIYDSEYFYTIEAAGFQMSNYEEVCIPPYTIKAIKMAGSGTGLETAWSYTVTDSTYFNLFIDSSEQYVFLRYNDKGKTVILNRKNGAYVTTLPVVIPSAPYTTSDNNNLYFLGGGSIQKYDPDTRTLKTVISKGGSCGRLQNGKITFIQTINKCEYNYAQFDMNTETVSYQSYPRLSEYEWTYTEGKLGVTPVDLDSDGNAVFMESFRDEQWDIQSYNLWVINKKDQTVKTWQMTGSDLRAGYVGFVKNETGKGVYLYTLYVRPGSSSYYHYFDLYDMSDDLKHVYSVSYKRTDGANNNGISYARLHSQEGYIYIMQGCDFGLEGTEWSIKSRIKVPGFVAEDGGSYYNWNWDVADEDAGYNDYLMFAHYNRDQWVGGENRVKMYTNSITKEQAEESALTRLGVFSQDATKVIEKNFTSVQDLADRVKAAVKEKTSLKLTTADGGPISLSKNLILKPGQTYYYEYEVKKPNSDGEETGKVNVTAPQVIFNTQNVYEGVGNLESYYVSDIVEEDFNSALNPFFKLDSGQITDGLQTSYTPDYSSSRDLSTSSQVSFTIPAGKTAIAMMDVTGYNSEITGSGYRSGVYINGQRYDQPLKSSLDAAGYVHPYPLKEGKNTIQVYVCKRTDEIYNDYVKIDNLKIIFLEKAPGAAGSSFSSVKADDGWTKVTGSFKAPEEINEFQSQGMEHYSDWPPGYGYTTGGTAYRYYDFTIPAGKTGKIFAAFQGSSVRDDSVGGDFNFPGWQVTHRGTRYASKGVLAYVESGETYYINNYQGATRFSTSNNTSQRSASFSRLEAYVYPDNLKDKKSFFFKDNKVYSISKTFDGNADFRINLNADGTSNEILLQHLNIYYMNGGNKVYLFKHQSLAAELPGWSMSGNTMTEIYAETKPEKEEDAPMVYKKGQLVSYNISYDDYENDPSKRQYWRYTHTPFNDGPHPDAAVILDEEGVVVADTGKILPESIPRFYIDGKYTVEHWQEDNTNRTGDTSGETDYLQYDKLSNVERITFYVEGGASAPWITSIKTMPATVKEGDQYRLQIGVDDAEKDILRLTTEVYRDKKLIYTHKQQNITADAGGIYPYITTGYPPMAEPGKYDVVCTVRDWSGTGIGAYQFIVVSEGKITGFVNHTDQWDENRKKYNRKRFDEEGNRPMQLDDYLAMPTPRLRGTNVFWSGEKFLLRSETEGKPLQVEVRIQSVNGQGLRVNTGYRTELDKTGRKTTAGAEVWEGSLWDSGMINRWGRREPEPLIFLFTAYYSGGITKTDEAMIIVDSRQDYWQLHRLW